MTSATIRSGPLASVAEFFTLRRAREVHAKLDEPARKQLADTLTLGRQKSDAAEALWANGHSAEALRLAAEALDAALATAAAYSAGMNLPVAPAPMMSSIAPAPAVVAPDAEPPASSDDAAPPSLETEDAAPTDAVPPIETPSAMAPTDRDIRRAALRDRGASPKEIEIIESAVHARRALKLPALDAEVTPALSELYQELTHARHALDRRFDTAAYARREITMARVARIGTTALIVIVATIATYLLTRRPEYTVNASAVWANAAAYDEEKALDDDTGTWWLVPDGQPGWLEVRFTNPHRINRIRLLNTANAPHMDRATNEYRVELYANGELVRTIDDTFAFTSDPDWVAHDVNLDGVERIRFVVESHHRTSAGLTELDWE